MLTIITFPFFGWFCLLVLIGGVLIDIDHYLWHIYNKRTLSVKKAYHFMKHKNHANRNMTLIFHNIEFWIAKVILVFFFPVLLPLFIGLASHMTMDLFIYFKNKHTKHLIYSLILSACAFLSKEMALTLPVILFIINIVWFREKNILYYVKTYIPFAFIWILYFIGRFFSIGFFIGGYMTFGQTNHLSVPILATLVSPTYYFTKMFNYAFLAEYPSIFIQSLSHILFDYRKIILLIILVSLFLLQKRKGLKTVFKNVIVLYILIILIAAPAWSMLVNIQMNGMDTRFLYFPTIFASILLAYLLAGIKNKIIKNTFITICLASFVILNVVHYIPWQRADNIKTDILTKLSQQKSEILEGELIYVAHIPDNYFGAYIFRNGFAESFENIVHDESILSDYNNRTIWQLKDDDMQGYMCRDHLLNGTHLYIWNPVTTEFVDKSNMLPLNKDFENTPIPFTTESKKKYNIVSWKNTLWENGPENINIKYAKQDNPKDFLSTCPLWLLSNI